MKNNVNDKDESQPEAIISGGQTFEETTFEKEIEKTLKQVVESLPEKIR
jgi:hypothetical protein